MLAGCEGQPGRDGVNLLGDDLQPPVVELVLPAAGNLICEQAAVEAHVSDDGAVAQVEFLVDGTASAGTGLTLGSPPWQTFWDCRTLPPGSHTLQALARDSDGKVGLSQLVLVHKAEANEPPDGDTIYFYDRTAAEELVWTLPDSRGSFAGYGTRFSPDRPCTIDAFLIKLMRDTSWQGTQVVFDIRTSQAGRPSEQPVYNQEYDGISMPLRQGISGWFRFPKRGSMGLEVAGDFFVLISLAGERSGDTLAVFSDPGIWRNWHGVALRDGEWHSFTAGPHIAFNPLIYAVVSY